MTPAVAETSATMGGPRHAADSAKRLATAKRASSSVAGSRPLRQAAILRGRKERRTDVLRLGAEVAAQGAEGQCGAPPDQREGTPCASAPSNLEESIRRYRQPKPVRGGRLPPTIGAGIHDTPVLPARLAQRNARQPERD